MKIGYVLILSILLSACGQTGPLYMPGTATGVHKKDEFVLGNAQSDQKKTPAANKNVTKPPVETVTPTADTSASSDTGVAQSADSSTTPNENSTPLGGQTTAPLGTVQ